MINGEQDTILYYPSIKIRDGDWLRKAVLYWDKVSSIVPGMNYQDDSWGEMGYLLNAGLYEPVYPSELEGDRELMDEFCNQVKEQLRLQNEKKKQSPEVKVHVNKAMYQDRQINTMNTPNRIFEFLLDEGIAKRKDEEWIYMTEYDSMVYMALLAKFLAKGHDRMHIGTDIAASFRTPFIMNGPERWNAEKQIYMNVKIDDILPCPIREGVSLDDLVEFKERHKKELQYFRRRINDYQRRLNACQCRDDIDEMAYGFRQEIENDMNEIEEYMRSRWKDVVRGTVTALVPLGMTYAEMKGYLPQHAGLTVSTVAGICSSFRYVKKDFVVNNSNAFLFSAIREGFMVTG